MMVDLITMLRNQTSELVVLEIFGRLGNTDENVIAPWWATMLAMPNRSLDGGSESPMSE